MSEATPVWFAKAACRGMTAVMYPTLGAASGRAKAVCASCDVRAECLAYALADPLMSVVGVWGGTNERERRRMRGGAPVIPVPVRKVAACGTMSGYQRHRRFDEPICEPCRIARRAYYTDRRRTDAAKVMRKERSVWLAANRAARRKALTA